jgi:hypothetical protein
MKLTQAWVNGIRDLIQVVGEPVTEQILQTLSAKSSRRLSLSWSHTESARVGGGDGG